MKTLLLFALLLVPCVAYAGEGDGCGATTRLDPVETVMAYAGVVINFRGGEESLRVQSAKLLRGAVAKLPRLKAPADLCREECLVSKPPQIILTAVPQKLLTDYTDREKCEVHLKNTTATPLLYKDKTFPTLEALADWFSDFSVGRGIDGKKLYTDCDGDCSPQYKLFITQHPDSTFALNAEVICGHARDKADDRYTLSQGYLWSCAPSANVHVNRARARNT